MWIENVAKVENSEVSQYSGLYNVAGKKQYRKYIADAVDYIHENFNREVSLKKLARISNKSQFHFTRMFKDEVGDSPYQYLIRYRLERAKEMLVHSEKTVGEVSYDVGFSSPSQFSFLFKRFVGITPKKYRMSFIK